MNDQERREAERARPMAEEQVRAITELNPGLRKQGTEIDPRAEALQARAEAVALRSEVELLRKKLEALEEREIDRDRELRSSLLSIVSHLERTHGWESKSRGGGRGSPPAVSRPI